MKFTNMQVEKNLEILLQNRGNIIGNKKVSYAIARNIRKMEQELKEYNDFKAETIEKYGKKVNDNYRIAREDYEDDTEFFNAIKNYENDMKEISNLEVEIDISEANIEDFNDNISAELFYQLDFMIKN